MCCFRRRTTDDDRVDDHKHDPIQVCATDSESFWAKTSMRIQNKISEWSLPKQKKYFKDFDEYLTLEEAETLEEGLSDHIREEDAVSVHSDSMMWT